MWFLIHVPYTYAVVDGIATESFCHMCHICMFHFYESICAAGTLAIVKTSCHMLYILVDSYLYEFPYVVLGASSHKIPSHTYNTIQYKIYISIAHIPQNVHLRS